MTEQERGPNTMSRNLDELLEAGNELADLLLLRIPDRDAEDSIGFDSEWEALDNWSEARATLAREGAP